MPKPIADGRIGKAFLCSDGIVRWVTGQSTRQFLHVLWRYPDGDVWYDGGIYHPKLFKDDGPEVPAPQAGQPYKRAGALGFVEIQTR